MSNRFAVINDGGLINRVEFEGSRMEVYAWLKDNSALDVPGFTVVDRSTSCRVEEGTFLRLVEEDMAEMGKLQAAPSAEQVRAIVRHELVRFIKAVREKSNVAEHFDNEAVEDTLVAVINHLADRKVNEELKFHEDQRHGDSRYEDC